VTLTPTCSLPSTFHLLLLLLSRRCLPTPLPTSLDTTSPLLPSSTCLPEKDQEEEEEKIRSLSSPPPLPPSPLLLHPSRLLPPTPPHPPQRTQSLQPKATSNQVQRRSFLLLRDLSGMEEEEEYSTEDSEVTSLLPHLPPFQTLPSALPSNHLLRTTNELLPILLFKPNPKPTSPGTAKSPPSLRNPPPSKESDLPSVPNSSNIAPPSRTSSLPIPPSKFLPSFLERKRSSASSTRWTPNSLLLLG